MTFYTNIFSMFSFSSLSTIDDKWIFKGYFWPFIFIGHSIMVSDSLSLEGRNVIIGQSLSALFLSISKSS